MTRGRESGQAVAGSQDRKLRDVGGRAASVIGSRLTSPRFPRPAADARNHEGHSPLLSGRPRPGGTGGTSLPGRMGGGRPGSFS